MSQHDAAHGDKVIVKFTHPKNDDGANADLVTFGSEMHKRFQDMMNIHETKPIGEYGANT